MPLERQGFCYTMYRFHYYDVTMLRTCCAMCPALSLPDDPKLCLCILWLYSSIKFTIASHSLAIHLSFLSSFGQSIS